MNVTEPNEDLPKLPVARAVWQPAPDFQTSTHCWLAAGAAHHTVMTTQIGVDVWEAFAKIAEVELAVIDEETTVRRFEDQLRWNAVYYRIDPAL